jgi:hypothetical protein
MRQFMQQEEDDVGVRETFGLRHGRGVVLHVFHLLVPFTELAFHVQQLVFDDVDDAHFLGARLDRRLHDARDDIAESARSDEHFLIPQIGGLETGDDPGDQAVVLKQQDGRDHRLEVDQPDQAHVRVDRVHMRGPVARLRRQRAHQQRAAGDHEEEQPRPHQQRQGHTHHDQRVHGAALSHFGLAGRLGYCP